MHPLIELEGPPPSLDSLRGALRGWRLEAADASDERTVYLDTFDWRLHRRGLHLAHRTASSVGLLELDENGDRLDLGAESAPAFARDLPSGELADRLRSTAGPRRLFPVVRVDREITRLPVRDDLDKLVAHLEIDLRAAARPPDGVLAVSREGSEVAADKRSPDDEAGARRLPTRLRVVPLKGFEEEARDLADLLRAALVGLREGGEELLDALAVWNLRPIAHGSKWLPVVGPEEPVGRVTGLFLEALRDTVVRNAPGLRQDLDIEFLHDLRVALRRTRSLLRELAAEPEIAATDALQEELAWLGGRTGPCRDLDVLTEALPGYVRRLRADACHGIEPLVGETRRRRSEAHAELLDDLASGRCRTLLATWGTFARELTRSRAGRPVRDVADERIEAVAARTLEKAAEVDEASPDRTIHRLRIRCKRLRYLLELFRSLYPAGDVDPVVATLRRLQDRLGTFQDLSVHGDLLRAIALEAGARTSMPPAALIATGTLLAQLQRAKRRQRRRVLGGLERFLAEEPDRVAALVGRSP